MDKKVIIGLVVIFIIFLALVYYVNEERFFDYFPPSYPDMSGDWQTGPDYALYRIWQFDNMALLQRMPDSEIYTLNFTSPHGGDVTSVQNSNAHKPAEPKVPIKFLTDGKVLQLNWTDKSRSYDFMRMSTPGLKLE